MASPRNLQYAVALISVFFLSSAYFSFPAPDIHDLLSFYNLPKGLLPRDLNSSSFSTIDNNFTIELSSSPCYVKFNNQPVHYDKIINGKLGYGNVSGVSGIHAKRSFMWVDVNGIDVDEKNNMIEFHMGGSSKELPAKDCEEIPSCQAKGMRKSFSFLGTLI